jgi:hypothetical protein
VRASAIGNRGSGRSRYLITDADPCQTLIGIKT